MCVDILPNLNRMCLTTPPPPPPTHFYLFVKPIKPIKSKQKSLFDKQNYITVKYY